MCRWASSVVCSTISLFAAWPSRHHARGSSLQIATPSACRGGLHARTLLSHAGCSSPHQAGGAASARAYQACSACVIKVLLYSAFGAHAGSCSRQLEALAVRIQLAELSWADRFHSQASCLPQAQHGHRLPASTIRASSFASNSIAIQPAWRGRTKPQTLSGPSTPTA